MLRTNDGSKVLEVNANPGLEGITKATGINVAEHIIKYAVKRASQSKWLIDKEEDAKSS